MLTNCELKNLKVKTIVANSLKSNYKFQDQSMKTNKGPPQQQVRRSKSRETLISNGDDSSEANYMARPATVISNTSGSSAASGNSNNL